MRPSGCSQPLNHPQAPVPHHTEVYMAVKIVAGLGSHAGFQRARTLQQQPLALPHSLAQLADGRALWAASGKMSEGARWEKFGCAPGIQRPMPL